MLAEEEIPESCIVSDEVKAYGLAVQFTFPERFDFLEESHICYMLANYELRINGSRKSAMAIIPNVRGTEGNIFWWAIQGKLGFLPDAFIVVDADDWKVIDEEKKVVLLYHELLHLEHKTTTKGLPCFSEDTGRPVLKIKAHDIEEFQEVAEKFGPWNEALIGFLQNLTSEENRFKEIGQVIQFANAYLEGIKAEND